MNQKDIQIRTIERENFTEFILNGKFINKAICEYGHYFEKICDFLQLQPVRAVVFASELGGDFKRHSRLPSQILLSNPSWPLEHSAWEIVAIGNIKSGSLQPLLLKDEIVGYCFASNNSKRMWISGLQLERESTEKELEECFDNIESLLSQFQLRFDSIDRTWFFLNSIIRDYPLFNRLRNRYFQRWDINRYPASTGIGLSNDSKSAVSISLNAFHSESARRSDINSQLQCKPTAYGPRFVRARLVEHDQDRELYVSGISAINDLGKSVHLDDVNSHVHFSIRSFKDLLEQGNMNLDDVVSCYVYCKNQKVADVFHNMAVSMLPGIHFHLQMGDVCREELQFEIEGRALQRR